jgi:hypothetical protein
LLLNVTEDGVQVGDGLRPARSRLQTANHLQYAEPDRTVTHPPETEASRSKAFRIFSRPVPVTFDQEWRRPTRTGAEKRRKSHRKRATL